MKKILFLFLGLISLVGLCSCEDKFTYISENEFIPLGYQPKVENLDEIDNTKDVITTFQIKGVKDLVIEEFEKDDWKILTTDQRLLVGNEPMKVYDRIVEVDNFNNVIDVPTNYGTIPIAFMNTVVSHDYMGKTMILQPLGKVNITITVEEVNKQTSPIFMQYGYIHIVLHIGYVPIARQKVQFIILEDTTQIYGWDWDSDEEESPDGTESNN